MNFSNFGRQSTVQQLRGNSFRTTIPIGVASQLELKNGDIIDWKIAIRKNRLVLIVEKVDSANIQYLGTGMFHGEVQ